MLIVNDNPIDTDYELHTAFDDLFVVFFRIYKKYKQLQFADKYSAIDMIKINRSIESRTFQ